MRINPLTAALQWANRVNDKKDGKGGHSRDQQPKKDSEKGQDSKDSQDSKNSKDSPAEFESKVRSAIAAFGTDSQAQGHGLQVDQVGAGPGLKVVLKDGTGAVVRQFTGEEFLQLRGTATSDPGPRGKLLDRKF